MKKRYMIWPFFSGVLVFSAFGYTAWNWIESNRPVLPYYGPTTDGKYNADGKKDKVIPVAGFSFRNQDGEEITGEFVKNKVWVADFFFTHCVLVCPKMTASLTQVRDAFPGNEDLKFLSFTCDPERDSVAQLKLYADMHQADARQWHFLTGDKKELYRFARKSLQLVATDGDGGPDDFIHSQNLVLIDREGYIRGYYDGTDEKQVQQLITDIKKILRP